MSVVLKQKHKNCDYCRKYFPAIISQAFDCDTGKHDYEVGCVYENSFPRCIQLEPGYRNIRADDMRKEGESQCS